MWALSYPNRDETHTFFIGRRSPNHWAAREVPMLLLLLLLLLLLSRFSRVRLCVTP